MILALIIEIRALNPKGGLMKRYDTVIIINPDITGEERQPVVERINGFISQHEGMQVLLDDWGIKKLAYEIKGKSRGYYIRFDYCGNGLLVNDIERFCRIDDRILKYMTILTDSDTSKEKIEKERAEALSRAQSAPHLESDEIFADSEPFLDAPENLNYEAFENKKEEEERENG